MAHQEFASSDRVQKRRARTGCLRCRTRRRKCDERKPRCQRCIDAEAECIYGQRLSFLQKNAFTLSPDAGDDSSPRKPETPNYKKVQFVADAATKQNVVGQSEEGPPSTASPLPNGRESTGAHHGLPLSGSVKTTSSISSGRPQSLCLDSNASYHNARRQVDQSQNIEEQNDASAHGQDDHTHQSMAISDGDSYEIALDVLVNLGAGDSGADTLAPATPAFEDNARVNGPSLPFQLTSLNELGTVTANVQNQLSSACTIHLLRHYRYKIAPWLDMCDMNQTFGLVIPHLATRSDMSFDALLKLCATSYAKIPYNRESLRNQSTNGDHVTYAVPYHVESSTTWEVKLWSILTAAEAFLIDPPHSWNGALANNKHLQMVCSRVAESSPLREVNECMLWVLARFGVAVALLEETTSIVNSNIIEPLINNLSRNRDETRYLHLFYAYEPLVLCIKALEFSYGDEEALSLNPEPRPRAARWKSIVDSLNNWYTNRPPMFRPVIDLNSEGSPFPTLYFSSGAATFASSCYHTAMILLLAHKPRTLQLDQRRSSSLSQLWHAQRICGIAVNNNRCECWDPFLLAAFYLAARHMTHESQQKEILRGFNGIVALGWFVDGFVERLHQEWLI